MRLTKKARSVLVICAVALLAGCGTHHALRVLHSAEAKAPCVAKLVSWYKTDQGKEHLKTAATDVKNLGKATEAFASARFAVRTVPAVASADTALMNAIVTLKNHMPPACLTGVNAPLSVGLGDYAAAIDDNHAMLSAARAKKYDAITTAFKLSDLKLQQGTKQIVAATRALVAYLHV